MTAPTQAPARRWPLVLLAALALVVAFAASRTCLTTGFRTGLWLSECPDGELRQLVTVNANSMVRGAKSYVTVSASAAYTTGPADAQQTAPISTFSTQLFLVTPTGETPLPPLDGWQASGSSRTCELLLPTVPDGDYLLRAQVTSRLGETTLDTSLPLFAPARVHLLTDRPLYEPGNTVQFRALALHAGTLAPLDGRPGVFRVTDPTGEVLLEEKAPVGDWGVAQGSFPLDSAAQSGQWQVSWTSGPASQSRSFTVKPFTLPRFRVEASAAKAFYRRNERPELRGEVRYSSGAPVANAKLELTWQVTGAWPAPTAWVDGSALPRFAQTSAAGRFELQLPQVPDDLQGQAHLTAAISAVDPSGDRVEGQADLLLSEDPIAVSAVTELAGGLVEGFNNRLFLRATTADGQVLSGAQLTVKRLWEATDPGLTTDADEDGVASVQLDPGPPVNVVIPASPFRPPAKADAVVRTDLSDPISEPEVTLADRLTFDRAEKALEGCTRYVGEEGGAVSFGVHVRANGSLAGVAGTNSRLSQCTQRVLEGLRFEPGSERLFSVSFQFNDEDLPRLTASAQGIPTAPDELSDAMTDALREVRDCLPSTIESGELQRNAMWRFEPKAQTIALTWVPVKNGGRVPEGVISCITSRLPRLTLPARSAEQAADEAAAVGRFTFTVEAAEKYEADRPQETVMEGYEFRVTATAGGEQLGSTIVRLTPGTIPDVRLRANQQLVSANEQVTIELLRGPDWVGELPEKLFLRQGARTWESKFDEEKRQAVFTMPADVEGWFSVQFESATVYLFSQPRSRLAVTITPEKPRYAPGQLARLDLETRIGGRGSAAAVGLFGVDDSLSQLAPLPGAAELEGLRPQVQSEFAFPSIDAQALAQGRVRGKNAAAATLLKVSSLPPPPELDTPVSTTASTVFDANAVLVDRFYAALQQLHVQTREWEASTVKSEKMSPRTMATLWSKALDALEKRNESSRDFWGRRLRLHRLPMDLLALTEPREVVVDGTRLSEDSENWNLWVAKEKP